MIYDYIVSPHPRRLVFTAAGLPTVTLPVDPALFGRLLDLVEAEGEAAGLRLHQALLQGLEMQRLQYTIIDEVTQDRDTRPLRADGEPHPRTSGDEGPLDGGVGV